MIDEEIPQELNEEMISLAPSIHTHTSVVIDMQNLMIQSSSKI